MTDPAQVCVDVFLWGSVCMYVSVSVCVGRCLLRSVRVCVCIYSHKYTHTYTQPHHPDPPFLPTKKTGPRLRRPHQRRPHRGHHRQRPRPLRGAAPAAGPAALGGYSKGDGSVRSRVLVGFVWVIWVVLTRGTLSSLLSYSCIHLTFPPNPHPPTIIITITQQPPGPPWGVRAAPFLSARDHPTGRGVQVQRQHGGAGGGHARRPR